jgi:hypothetical protein
MFTLRLALAGCLAFFALPPGSAAADDAAAARHGLEAAVAAGRLPEAQAAAYQASVTRAARSATVAAVLHDVAAQAAVYDGPRAAALFGMLDANLAQSVAAPRVHQDIAGADGVVYRYFAGHGFQFHPLANFARLNRLLTRRDLRGAERLARALIARGIRSGDGLSWEYYFPFGGPSRWSSGFAQAIAAQALARAGEVLGEPALGLAARAAFRALQRRFLFHLAHGLWIQEYSYTHEVILNAQLQTLVSLTNFAKRTGDPAAQRVVTGLDTASRALLPAFDTGCWSRYSYRGQTADAHYHAYHVELLYQLATLRHAPIWRTTAKRWARYLRSRPC